MARHKLSLEEQLVGVKSALKKPPERPHSWRASNGAKGKKLWKKLWEKPEFGQLETRKPEFF